MRLYLFSFSNKLLFACILSLTISFAIFYLDYTETIGVFKYFLYILLIACILTLALWQRATYLTTLEQLNQKLQTLNTEVNNQPPATPTEQTVATFDTLSETIDRLVIQIENHNRIIDRKNTELSKAHLQTGTLVELGRRITSCLETDEIIKESFSAIQQLFDTNLLATGLYNTEKQGLDMSGIRAGTDTIFRHFEDMTDKNRWSVHCFETQQEILCKEYDQYCGKYFSNLLFDDPNNIRQSFIYLPLMLRNKTIGVLSVQSFRKRAFTQHHMNILKNLGMYIAIALENARTYTRIARQKDHLMSLTNELENARTMLEEQVHERTCEILKQKQEIEEKNHELETQRESILEQSRKLAEINTELERLSLVARKTDNAIMIMDAKGDILWINECFSRLYNYTYDTFIRTRGNNIRQTSFNPSIGDYLQSCITTKKPVHYDALNIKGDGTEIWTQTSLTPVVDDKGEITHLLTIDSDITVLKEAQSKIEQQARDIRNSIQYACRIQEAVLPHTEELSDSCRDFFVLFKPRDIVSGDFYWWYRRDNKLAIAVADCTGHGVPGAFMSMLGISFLNEISKSDSLNSSGQMLDRLRRRVKSTLRQNQKALSPADGMDIALCIFDFASKTVCFSGAFNPLLVYSSSNIKEYPANRMPIGVYRKDNESFTDNVISYTDDDRFYLLTDGYPDQFGGPNNNKFSRKQLKEILAAIGHLPMNRQKEELEQRMSNWMNPSCRQIDDICLLGIQPLT